MINHAAARAELAGLAGTILAGRSVTVYPQGPSGVPAFPAVIIGQPRVDFTAGPNTYHHKTTFPVALVVGRPGSNDPGAVGQLEELWPVLAQGLGEAAEVGDLGGVSAQAVVTRAEFGGFNVQGETYPAQTIFIDLYG